MKEEYEGKWIEKGGIVFYSFQAETWEPYTQASGSKDDEIRKYAKAVKQYSPHKIMVCPGYEPDLYLPETAGTSGKGREIRGTAEDFRNMRANWNP